MRVWTVHAVPKKIGLNKDTACQQFKVLATDIEAVWAWSQAIRGQMAIIGIESSQNNVQELGDPPLPDNPLGGIRRV